MHVLIVGAAGMIGRKLAHALARDGVIGGAAVDRMTLVDVVEPETPAGFAGAVTSLAADISAPGAAAGVVAGRPDVIFHLAAVVSGEAEADLDKGYRVNLDGTRALFDAIRAKGLESPWCPRVVFTSSLAVFGPPLPDKVPDDQQPAPMTSYGTQKAMGELMLCDYSRRGILDGVGLRLPTICIRPGKPNKAASGFYSAILREPLAGLEAVLPVDDSLRHWFASPRAAVGFLLRAAAMDTGALGQRRILNLPGVSATVGQQLEALGRVAGPQALRLIRRVPDPAVAAIVSGWPRDFAPLRALALGFRAEADFDEIIRVHVEDELGGRLP